MIEWSERYNVHRARIGMFRLTVVWDERDGQKGHFAEVEGYSGVVSKTAFKSVDEAKVAALRIALAQSKAIALKIEGELYWQGQADALDKGKQE